MTRIPCCIMQYARRPSQQNIYIYLAARSWELVLDVYRGSTETAGKSPVQVSASALGLPASARAIWWNLTVFLAAVDDFCAEKIAVALLN